MIRACVFAHYDKDNLVDDYVYYYLNELLTVTQKLMFVTVSDISKNDIERLENLNIEVVKRENIGYDFYSYKLGIERLDLNLYDELIICNDSVFGPLVPLKNIFAKMQDEKSDFWGITDSGLISYHVQSYFFVFRNSILQSSLFSDFWDKLKILEDKNEIVKRYEVGISQILLEKNYRSQVYVKYTINKKDNSIRLLKRLWGKPYKIFKLLISPSKYYDAAIKKRENSSILFWDNLLVRYQLPFVKKSLFVDKNEGVENMKKLKVIFQKKLLKADYDIDLIENYFDRMKS